MNDVSIHQHYREMLDRDRMEEMLNSEYNTLTVLHSSTTFMTQPAAVEKDGVNAGNKTYEKKKILICGRMVGFPNF